MGSLKPRGLDHRESLVESKRKKRKCCAGGLAVLGALPCVLLLEGREVAASLRC